MLFLTILLDSNWISYALVSTMGLANGTVIPRVRE